MTASRGGLRRFVGPPGAPRRPAGPEDAHPHGQAAQHGEAAQPAPPEVDKCEMCGTPAGTRHGHVVDVEHRSLMCACRPCFLLFTREDAGAGRYRAVPERYLHNPERPLSGADWDSLGIPVGSAFFLRSDSGVAAFYPSPVGATECLLDLQAWADLGTRQPLLAAAAPEVEAILIRAVDQRVDCFLVPIDACYELVGTVRAYWKGFDGGQEARERIDEFFAGIASRARRYRPEA